MSQPEETNMSDNTQSTNKKKGSKIMIREQSLPDIIRSPEQVQPSFDVSYGGSTSEKFSKFTKNPLVPTGAVVTAGILIAGLLSFRSGNVQLSQQLMRARVLAQGATLGVLSLSVARMQIGTNGWSSGGDDVATENDKTNDKKIE